MSHSRPQTRADTNSRSKADPKANLATLERHFAGLRDLEHAGAILGWDQEVMMPRGGAGTRGHALATLTSVAIEKACDPELEAAVEQLERQTDDLSAAQRRTVELARRRLLEVKAVPKDLAVEFSLAKSGALEAWRVARAEDDFASFAPALERNLDLSKRIAQARSAGADPYDAAIDHYEPGGSAAQFDPLLEELEQLTRELLEVVNGSRQRPEDELLTRAFEIDAQRDTVAEVAGAMGIDPSRSRLDLSTHPFCGGVGPGDVRMTGRYDREDLRPGFFGAIHEAGHGLYEQGLDPKRARSVLGGAVSMAIHESQSRLWENLIARSQPFWKHWTARLRKRFPDTLAGVRPEQMWRAVNSIRPSMIRVEADELTYNLHIILRYRIERELFTGTLAISDLPERWNTAMQESLGLTPRNDAEGCLQDIHWAMGAFGYFPTYSIGNLYSAQFLEAARRDLPNLDADVARGNMSALSDWLGKKIHRHDRLYTADQLVRRVTRKSLSVDAFKRYATAKVEALYG